MSWFGRTRFLTVSAIALSVAACNKSGSDGSPGLAADGALPDLPAAMPMQAGPSTPIAAAPPVQALPAGHRVRVARLPQPSEAYAYIDRATGVADAIGDAPPDYAYDVGPVSPWAWQTGEGDMQYAEPIEGGYRYYYYTPGAATPYLVRGPDYSYSYSGDELIAIFDARGVLLSPDQYDSRLDYASRYFDRAIYLNRLAQEREHRGVVAANWAAQRAEIAADLAQLADARAQQAVWQAYHAEHAAQEEQHWAEERQQRQWETQRFTQWQQVGLRRPPPQPVAVAMPPPLQHRGLPAWLGGGWSREQQPRDLEKQQQVAPPPRPAEPRRQFAEQRYAQQQWQFDEQQRRQAQTFQSQQLAAGRVAAQSDHQQAVAQQHTERQQAFYQQEAERRQPAQQRVQEKHEQTSVRQQTPEAAGHHEQRGQAQAVVQADQRDANAAQHPAQADGRSSQAGPQKQEQLRAEAQRPPRAEVQQAHVEVAQAHADRPPERNQSQPAVHSPPSHPQRPVGPPRPRSGDHHR